MQIKYLVTIYFIFFSNISYADYDADDLNQLFTNKNQRAQIDAQRSGNYSSTDKQPAQKVKVSGYMTRSDGKSVVWVNSKNTLEGSRVGGVKVHGSSVGKNKKVTVSVDNKTTRLKPGEVWHKETDKIVDNQ